MAVSLSIRITKKLRVGRSAPWAEALVVTAPEPCAISSLVVSARAKLGRVSRVGLFQLPLTLEIPVSAVNTFVFLTGLPALDQSSVMSGTVSARGVFRTRRSRCSNGAILNERQVLLPGDGAITIFVHPLERGG